MKEVFVVEAARTAVARAGKQSWFTNVRADDLSAIVIKDLRRRIGLGEDKEKQKIVGDVYWAATANAFKEQGGNIGRNAWLLSGGSYDVPGMTVDRFCASSLSALVTCHATMAAGWSGDVSIAGGAQHMTHIPMGAGADPNPDRAKYYDPMSPLTKFINAGESPTTTSPPVLACKIFSTPILKILPGASIFRYLRNSPL
jgi:acetyl-CoA acyltransferase